MPNLLIPRFPVGANTLDYRNPLNRNHPFNRDCLLFIISYNGLTVDIVSGRVLRRENTAWSTSGTRQLLYIRRKNYPFDSMKAPASISSGRVFVAYDHPIKDLVRWNTLGGSVFIGENTGLRSHDKFFVEIEAGSVDSGGVFFRANWESGGATYQNAVIRQETLNSGNIRGIHAGPYNIGEDYHHAVSIPVAPDDSAAGGPEVDLWLNGAVMPSKTLDQTTGTTIETDVSGKISIMGRLSADSSLRSESIIDYYIVKNGETTDLETNWLMNEAEAGFPNLLNRIDRFQIFADAAAAASDIKSVNTVSWL